jgi:hypothetical protein
MNNTATAVVADTSGTWYPASYTGLETLAGFEGTTGPIAGEYLAHESGAFLFRPTDSSLIFEVSDLDIVRNLAV